MQPRQMRETDIPVRPSLVYCIVTPVGGRAAARPAAIERLNFSDVGQIPATGTGCQERNRGRARHRVGNRRRDQDGHRLSPLF